MCVTIPPLCLLLLLLPHAAGAVRHKGPIGLPGGDVEHDGAGAAIALDVGGDAACV